MIKLIKKFCIYFFVGFFFILLGTWQPQIQNGLRSFGQLLSIYLYADHNVLPSLKDFPNVRPLGNPFLLLRKDCFPRPQGRISIFWCLSCRERISTINIYVILDKIWPLKKVFLFKIKMYPQMFFFFFFWNTKIEFFSSFDKFTFIMELNWVFFILSKVT